MKKRFNTIDGQTLMTMPLQPLEFVIEKLLSKGLNVPAGSPKVFIHIITFEVVDFCSNTLRLV